MRHDPRHRDLPAIFESDGEAARQIAVSDCRARSRDSWGDRESAGACFLLGRFQRQTAALAAALAEELDARPALGAEAVNLVHDRFAAGAARGEREIERGPDEQTDELRTPSIRSCRVLRPIAQAPACPTCLT